MGRCSEYSACFLLLQCQRTKVFQRRFRRRGYHVAPTTVTWGPQCPPPLKRRCVYACACAEQWQSQWCGLELWPSGVCIYIREWVRWEVARLRKEKKWNGSESILMSEMIFSQQDILGIHFSFIVCPLSTAIPLGRQKNIRRTLSLHSYNLYLLLHFDDALILQYILYHMTFIPAASIRWPLGTASKWSNSPLQ